MFGFGWHIELLCAKLAALRAGKIGRLTSTCRQRTSTH
jgi:hypothetical protein